MTVDRVKTLLDLMKENELTELEFEEENFRVYLKKGGNEVPQVMAVSAPPAPRAETKEPLDTGAKAKKDDNLLTITSPIVGTFYRSPTPEEPPFADVGDSVNADDIVCIIEAMKVMNNVKAEVSGVIKETLVENAQPVEFGQPLFLVEPR